MFDKFEDYLFYLLPGPLKVPKQENQFKIFFKIMGEMADEIKVDMFRFRKETIINSASPPMIEIFGKERKMAQMKGEDIGAYRKRLQMKAIIAECAGTEKGILLALQSIGYRDCKIEPMWRTDPERWAEFYVDFPGLDLDEDYQIDFGCINRTVMEVKRASALPNYRFFYPTVFTEDEYVNLKKTIIRMEIIPWDSTNLLNGGWLLNGSVDLDAELNLCNTKIINRMAIEENEYTDGSMIINHNLWMLDGNTILDGRTKIDAWTREEIL